MTAAATGGASTTVTASVGSVQGTESVLFADPPAVARAAAAAASTVTGTTVRALSPWGVRGRREQSEVHLGGHFAARRRHAPDLQRQRRQCRQNTTVTFHAAGAYTFTVTITDPGNRCVTSSVTVTVNQTLSKITVSPLTSSILTLATQQFSAWGFDQFGAAMPSQPTVTWTASNGMISPTGLLTAPGIFGTATVTATSGAVKGSASVTFLNQAPTVATAAAAASSTVTGTTVQLSVVRCRRRGREQSQVHVVHHDAAQRRRVPQLHANGTNAAKNTTVTFTSAGTYGFTVTSSTAADSPPAAASR